MLNPHEIFRNVGISSAHPEDTGWKLRLRNEKHFAHRITRLQKLTS